MSRGNREMTQHLQHKNTVPPKTLMNSLFRAYAKTFIKDETEHTLLYYFYKLEQIQKTYKLGDLVQVVALDLLEDMKRMKQDEPTLVEEQNMSIGQLNYNQQISPMQ